MSKPSEEKSKTLGRMIASGGVLVAALGLAYLFLTPKLYQAAARIKVIDWVRSKDLGDASNDQLMPRECALVRSNAMLDQVARNLRLNEVWAKRPAQAAALNDDEIRARLRQQMFVNQVGISSVMEIRVQSDDREETARIANEFARLYLDYRSAQHQDLLHGKLDTLRQQWDEQSQKIGDAQAAVDKLYFAVMKERATNTTEYFDAETFDALRNTHVKLEAEYVNQQQQLNDFKKMDPEDLKQVLSSMDTNSVLIPPMQGLSKAKNRLRNAKLDLPPDSPEVKAAMLEVERFNQRIAALVPAIMQAKEGELADLKSRLDGLDARLKNASTNVNQADTQYTAYQDALDNLKKLQHERDDLKQKMDAEESHEAILPPTVTAELIDPAEAPLKPFIPDSKLALGIISGGGLAALAGLILLLAAQKGKEAIQEPAGESDQSNSKTQVGERAGPERP